METATIWLAFIGSWLLFAGPVYQAALELQEQDIEADRIRAAHEKLQKPPQISAWWWLLPPIKFYLEQKRSNSYRAEYFKALLPEDAEAIVTFISKARGWLFVAAGGFCIAVHETYELVEHQDWSNNTLYVLVVALLLLSIGHTIWQLKRARRVTGK